MNPWALYGKSLWGGLNNVITQKDLARYVFQWSSKRC